MNRLSCLLLVAALGLTSMPLRAADVPAALPKETEYVMYINFRQVIDSDIMKKFALGQIKQALKQNDAQKLLEEMGLDPLKDIEKVYVGSWGKDPQNMETLAFMTGKFDGDKLIATAEKIAKDQGDKVSIVEEGDYKLIKMIGQNNKPFYASVADGKNIVAGTDKKLVANAIKAIVKKDKPVLTKELSALVLKQDEKASMWMCGVTEGKFGELAIPEIPLIDGKGIKNGLAKTNTVSAVIRLGEDVSISLNLGMKDADAADEFSTVLGKLVDLAKAFLPNYVDDKPELKGLVDDVTKSLKAESKEKEVIVKAKISADAIAKATGKEPEKKDK